MNALIIKELDIMRRTSVSEEKGGHKSRQYATAIKTIQELPSDIVTMADVPSGAGTGIGDKIREKISEILDTGALAAADKARAVKAPDSLDAFQKIYGVGPKKAAELVAAGYTTIAELTAAAAKDPKLLNKNQRVGLRYYEDLQLRIPRSEMEVHEATLMSHKPAALEGVIVGSFRRGRPDSGDIDMMISPTTEFTDGPLALANYVATLRAVGYLKEILALGPHKCLAISQLPGQKARRLDLLVTPPSSFAASVLYFTGSDGFNVAMRQVAKDKGFTLNEHGLMRTATKVFVTGLKQERDIFTALGLQWKEPHERTGPEAVIVVPK